MKPFEYRSPASVSEAIALFADVGEKARPLAGGTDLLVQMRRGLYDPDLLVDVKRIPELNQIAFDLTGGLTIGAAVSCARLCENADVREAYPALIDAASIIGGGPQRNACFLPPGSRCFSIARCMKPVSPFHASSGPGGVESA